MDLIKEAISGMEADLVTQASSPVLYTRGETTKTVNAVIGETQVEAPDYDGVMIKSKTADFLILKDDLGMEPRRGDKITHDGVIFDVTPTGADEKAWRFTTGHRNMYRIHTKEYQ